MWNIGDKILCINDTNWKISFFGFKTPKTGEIYTIRAIFPIKDSPEHGILLEEIVNFNIEVPGSNRVAEPTFFDWRFTKFDVENIELEDQILQEVERLLETEVGVDMLLDLVNE